MSKLTIAKLPLLFLFSLCILAGCKNKEEGSPITAAEIKSHIAVLADDSLQGRKPFTRGEIKTTRYISDEFKKEGLEPGNQYAF